jgi:hypothetical protein
MGFCRHLGVSYVLLATIGLRSEIIIMSTGINFNSVKRITELTLNKNHSYLKMGIMAFLVSVKLFTVKKFNQRPH